MVREESYYYAPQGMTKVMNEGWACVTSDALVFTDQGIMTMGEIVRARAAVRAADGISTRPVYDWASFNDLATIRIRTRRGFEFRKALLPIVCCCRMDHGGGSMNWRSTIKVKIGAGPQLWANELVKLDWKTHRRVTLDDAADMADVSIDTILRFREGRNVRRGRGVGGRCPI